MELLRTFKESYLITLKEKAKSGDSAKLYENDHFDIDTEGVKPLARIYAPETMKQKLEDIESKSDLEAASLSTRHFKT